MTMPTARPVPSNSPVDLLFNAEKLDEVVNSDELTYRDRFGLDRMTLQGAIDTIKSIRPRGAWAASTAYATKDVVQVAGTWYIAVEAHTSGATFAADASNWRVYQEGGFLQSGAGSVPRTLEEKARETFSSADKGAPATGIADAAASLNAFLAQAKKGKINAGTYRITSLLDFHSGQVIEGDGPATVIVFDPPSVVANAPVLRFSGVSHVRLKNLTLRVPVGFPTARSIFIENSADVVVEDVLFDGGAGGNAAYIINSTACAVRRLWLDDYRSNGIYVNGGRGCVVEDCDIPNGSGGMMGVQIVSGESHQVNGNRIASTPDNYFGIHVFGGKFHKVSRNTVKNTRREAIAIGGWQNIGCEVTFNTMYWDTNLGVGDFGMSVAGEGPTDLCTEFLIHGNMIMNSALDGIGVAGWCQRGRITSNTIRDCAQMAASGHQAGIKLYGWVASAVCDDITVESNSFVKFSGGMLYAVDEAAGLGIVNRTFVKSNRTIGLTGDIYRITGAASRLVLNDTDINAAIHNVVVTATSGSITSAAASLKYQRVGKLIHCTLGIIVTTNGTGAGTLRMALPFTATGGILTGSEGTTGGKAVKAGISVDGNYLAITNYDNTYPGFNGAGLSLSGILEVA